ncbi:sulfite exporter TauE/SafE family protein [Polaromonas sp. CG_9.5]|uniref:sulfite exporter TauE/SafE family protein n=1 Tax=Polaromonas sp. CG_9.5 TaxID=3071705 RepID=UPI002E0F54E3
MVIILGLGLLVGIILALTGAGGGILAVPLLIFGVGLSVAEAAPIGLLAVGMAAALGAGLGLKAGAVRYKAALLMAGSGILFSPLGTWLAHRMDNRWLGVLFAGVLLFVAYRTFQKAQAEAIESEPGNHQAPPCIRDAESGRFVWTTRCARSVALSGTVTGFLSGLLGVGGGFVLVPALQRYTDLSMKSVVATSLAVIALVSASGVLSSTLAGHLNWAIAIPFCGGALAGMMGGRLIASRLAGPQLQKGFAAISALVAIGMIGKSFL